MAIVYSVTNKLTNKTYIGVSGSSTLTSRRKTHRLSLKDENTPFYKDWRKVCKKDDKWGDNYLEWKVLKEGVSMTKALELEKRYIEKHNTIFPFGYNLTWGGERPPSSESISKSLKDRPLTEKHKKNISKGRMGIEPWNKGKPCSEETKEKISISLKKLYKKKK